LQHCESTEEQLLRLNQPDHPDGTRVRQTVFSVENDNWLVTDATGTHKIRLSLFEVKERLHRERARDVWINNEDEVAVEPPESMEQKLIP
jgi:hypothetical protein